MWSQIIIEELQKEINLCFIQKLQNCVRLFNDDQTQSYSFCPRTVFTLFFVTFYTADELLHRYHPKLRHYSLVVVLPIHNLLVKLKLVADFCLFFQTSSPLYQIRYNNLKNKFLDPPTLPKSNHTPHTVTVTMIGWVNYYYYQKMNENCRQKPCSRSRTVRVVFVQ